MLPKHRDQYAATFPEQAHRTAAEFMGLLTGVESHCHGRGVGPTETDALLLDEPLDPRDEAGYEGGLGWG